MTHSSRSHDAATKRHEPGADSPSLAAFLRAKDDAHAAVRRNRGTSLRQRALAVLGAASAFFFLSSPAAAVHGPMTDPHRAEPAGDGPTGAPPP
jgi:hypothetical protein